MGGLMVSRIYLKDCLSFKEIDLEFKPGLNVFTGPSGAGKSILMQAILSLFSLAEFKSSLGEVLLTDSNINDDLFDIEDNDDIIIKSIKKEKTRFFVNNQSISKKNLNLFTSKLIKHLNLRDTSDFDNIKLLNFLDSAALKLEPKFKKTKDKFDSLYVLFQDTKKQLQKISEDESKLEDLKEYAKYEIEKIELINPSVDEYEELNLLKRKLAKKDKIEDSIKKSSPILDFNTHVSTLLDLLEEDSSFFDDAMNELTNIFEKHNDSLSELEDVDIENVLDRIEKLAALQKRFGSIAEALKYLDLKKEELISYDNISFEKSELEKKLALLESDIQIEAKNISSFRGEVILVLEGKINHYLKSLYLNNAKIVKKTKSLDSHGIDEILFELDNVSLDTISSGEYNRLRLALLTSISEFDIIDNGILFLDEIDANLSGKESDAIAKVLLKLSKSYQIFAISHQPQLTASSNQHFFVNKSSSISTVRLLTNKQRVSEIARMISGEEITNQALDFAKNLLKNKK
jgi:DNA repair protein RecN (Recombination protein N)